MNEMINSFIDYRFNSIETIFNSTANILSKSVSAVLVTPNINKINNNDKEAVDDDIKINENITDRSLVTILNINILSKMPKIYNDILPISDSNPRISPPPPNNINDVSENGLEIILPILSATKPTTEYIPILQTHIMKSNKYNQLCIFDQT